MRQISPLVINAELSTVAAWDPNQEDTDKTLEVKVSEKAREVTASYPVDEQTMAIRIALPPTYPLAPITVTSINRVAVPENKWRLWLVNTQGIINFASSSGGMGGIIDGLVAWRRNVIGALKGQSECAICYSVVSADRQLPSKKCGTCKNLFHGSCLYRWFKSSGSSSCPLCRNAFNYG
jgi:E3 ubiquitin-protein ligase listerin